MYEAIAQGGMCSVHVGRLVGPGGFARIVAIKRLHPQFASAPELVSMLLDEARLVARIRHLNVVPTLDIVTEAHELFLVMEYVPGESLSQLLKAAREHGVSVPPRVATTIVAGVLHGLHAAHGACSEDGEPLGIVHRDVSPHNVLVGVDGVARLLDFGVAKARGRLQTTRTGQVKGKLAYMAPEQIAGDVGPAADVFSACVILWEALAGRPLFAAGNEGEMLWKVLHQPIAPPRCFAPHLPRVLDDIVLRGLQREPKKRFGSARDVALSLERDVGVADPREIGEWVAALSRERLDHRAALVARIEQDATLRATSGRSLPPGGVDPDRLAAVTSDDVVSDLPNAAGSSQLTAVTPAAVYAIQSGGPKRRQVLRRVGVLLGAVVLAVVMLRRGPRTASDPPPTGAAAGQSAGIAGSSSALPSASREAEPTTVAIDIDTTPAGATVLIGGAARGTTPLVIDIERGVDPVALELRLDGYAPRHESVRPDVNQRLVLSLVREPHSQPAVRNSGGRGRIHRFD